MSEKTFVFNVSGMHCSSCVYFLNDVIGEQEGVKKVDANLESNSIVVVGDFGDKDPESIAGALTLVVKDSGYTLSVEKKGHSVSWREFKVAVPIAIGFLAFFIFLQKLGVVSLIGKDEMSFGTALIIGLVASVSTCMATVGGLVLSMSANYAKEGDKVRPQVMFHISRLVSFFIFGGIIGLIGSTVTLGLTGTLVLGIVVAVVMLILGMNLLDIFPWMHKLTPRLPSFITKHVTGLKTFNHILTPIFVGALTFILPCGFTQSMQIYSLSLGSFWGGAMTMFVFALGTLPVLLILSFGASGFHDKIRSGIFFKTAGLVVIMFAVLNLLATLAGAGIIPPIINL